MGTRNKIEANKKIFGLLDEYCASEDEPLSNAGKRRWIETNETEREFLIEAQLSAKLAFAMSVKIARFDFSNCAYFVSIGLDAPELPSGLIREELHAGVLTAFLAELRPRPNGPVSSIRNAVEAMDYDSDPHYEGHSFASIAGLFPKIQVFSAPDLLMEVTENSFFSICLADRRRVEQWIDRDLADALGAVAELTSDLIPFEDLCRSLLDLDSKPLFLALYRSLEVLYAHAKATEVISEFNLLKTWVDTAAILEKTLRWHPREEDSLASLFEGCLEKDLLDVAKALGKPITLKAKPHSFVANCIYDLRNALVHYRPYNRRYSTESVNWNRLCEAMTRLVCHLHRAVSATSTS